MKYSLEKGNKSNYEIQVALDDALMASLKEKVLKTFQKDIKAPGFRQGHVPLDMVETQIRPGYLQVGILEEVVHDVMTKVLDENKDIQFIGQPYDFDPSQLMVEKDSVYNVVFKVDVYPEMQEKDAKWKKLSLNKIAVKVEDEKKNSVLQTIKKQYAEYKDTDAIAEDTVSKIAVRFLDKDNNELLKRTVYVGEEEFTKEAKAKKLFVGMKKGEVIEKKYSAKTTPDFLLYTGEGKPALMMFDIKDCKKVELPVFTDEFVAEKFGGDGWITSVASLMEQVEKTLGETQAQEELQKAMEDFLTKAEASFDLIIPKTFVQEEMKHRMKSMEQKLGGEAGFKKFIESMGEEKAKAYLDEMEKTAEKSLHKFLLLKKIVDENKLDTVDWNTAMDAEKKLYEFMTWDKTLFGKEEKKEEEKKTNAKKSTKK